MPEIARRLRLRPRIATGIALLFKRVQLAHASLLFKFDLKLLPSLEELVVDLATANPFALLDGLGGWRR
jgi:hypothetical protein